MIKKFDKKKKGFTLIELIIVIAIIAILAAIAIPKFATIRHNANVSTDISNAKNIHSIVAQGIANEKISTTTALSSQPLGSVGGSYNVTSSLEAGGTKSKVTGDNFTVDIDTSGNITVKAGTHSIYPKLDSGDTTFEKK